VKGRAVTAALLGLGLVVGGCGVATVETTFDDALIRDVGSGSVAVKSIETTLTDALKANTTFNEPSTEKVMERLLRGQLNQLTVEDMTLMARTNRLSRRRFQRILRKLNAVKADVTAAKVDVSAHRDLTEGAQEFLRAWDDYLSVNADRVAKMRQGLADLRPMFTSFDELLVAAIDTARLGHTRNFDRLRDQMLDTLQTDVAAFQSTIEAVTKPGDADKRLLDLINEDQEAQAIVTTVNKRYPNGYLAGLDE
jgi:hypothetical protein